MDVDSKESDGRTPLPKAIWGDREAVLKLLLTAGRLDIVEDS